MNSYFKEWVVVFPGKMGISWKNPLSIYLPPGDRFSSFEQANEVAEQNRNTCVVPYEFFKKYKEYESRMVRAERKLEEFGVFNFGKNDSESIGSV